MKDKLAEYEERAAIMEFEGNMSQEKAEFVARMIILHQYDVVQAMEEFDRDEVRKAPSED